MQALGRRIRQLRNERRMSQEELSYSADIPLSQVGRIERGEVNTTVSTLYAISIALNIQIKEFFEFPFQNNKIK